MMIDDDTLKQLLRINDELLKLERHGKRKNSTVQVLLSKPAPSFGFPAGKKFVRRILGKVEPYVAKTSSSKSSQSSSLADARILCRICRLLKFQLYPAGKSIQTILRDTRSRQE